jgi:hypothetical protein
MKEYESMREGCRVSETNMESAWFPYNADQAYFILLQPEGITNSISDQQPLSSHFKAQW